MTHPQPPDDPESPDPVSGGRRSRWLDVLGPGLITGASDDDPSGIATYSQAGAQFGYGLTWVMLFSWPLMAAAQMVSARIGRVTGLGLAGVLRRNYPPALMRAMICLLLVANVINLGADLGAMADAAALLPSARIDAFPPRVVSAARAKAADSLNNNSSASSSSSSSSYFDVPFSLADGSPAADRFSCSLQGPADDGSLWSPCSSPQRLDFAAMVDGSYVLRVAAESDAAALAQQAAAQAGGGGGGGTTSFNGRGAPASASFVLDSVAPNVTSIALQAQTTLRGGRVNTTLLENVDLTYGAANEVRISKKKSVCVFFPRRSRFF